MEITNEIVKELIKMSTKQKIKLFFLCEKINNNELDLESDSFVSLLTSKKKVSFSRQDNTYKLYSDILSYLIYDSADFFTGEIISPIGQELKNALSEIKLHFDTKLEISKRKKEKNPNANKIWTSSENEQLLKEFLDQSLSISDIAKIHGRSRNAIRQRLIDLKLIETQDIQKK